MTSQINGLNMAVRNANDAISLVQTADGALVEVSRVCSSACESLAVQAASGTTSLSDKEALNTELVALRNQIEDIADDTQWNGTDLLDGDSSSVAFQVGANAGQTVTMTTLADLQTAGTAFSSLSGTSGETTLATLVVWKTGNLATSVTAADNAITGLDSAITVVNTKRAELGAMTNRLEYAADNLANVSQNTSSSRSRVLDADYASETTELARTQIIQQAATAMLSQANQQAQSVLALLR